MITGAMPLALACALMERVGELAMTLGGMLVNMCGGTLGVPTRSRDHRAEHVREPS